MADIWGIDVSRHQGPDINWPKVKAAGCSFAAIRATISWGYTDAWFARNREGVKAAGIPWTAYHVVYPDQSPERQIRHFIDTVGEKPPMPLVLDVELDRGMTPQAITVNLKECSEWVRKLDGRLPIIYTGKWWWDQHTEPQTLTYPIYHSLWVADYRDRGEPALPRDWQDWLFWQKSDRGAVDGIAGNVDLDVFNGDESAFHKWLTSHAPGNGREELIDEALRHHEALGRILEELKYGA